MMDIEEWIKEHMFYTGVVIMRYAVNVDDLRELLKTHAIVPREPTDHMVSEAQVSGLDTYDEDVKDGYKAMIAASENNHKETDIGLVCSKEMAESLNESTASLLSKSKEKD